MKMLFTMFLVSIILSLLFTPVAIKLRILDNPNYRKIHTNPVPKAGGLGIFVPFIFMLVFYFLKFGVTNKEVVIILTMAFLVIVGIVDDKIELDSKTKLIFQVIAACVTIFTGNVLNITYIYIVDCVISLIFIVGIINAINLIDGLDGLAAGIAAISSLAYIYIGYTSNNNFALVSSIVLIGNLIGFLKYNFRPAKIFMGDTGSLPLGYMLAVTGISCSNSMQMPNKLFFLCMVLGLPIYDTLLSMIRRRINGKSIFAPDRSHFYNLLMDLKGIEHRNVVMILYIINIVLNVIAVLLIKLGMFEQYLSVLVILMLVIYLTIKLKLVKVD